MPTPKPLRSSSLRIAARRHCFELCRLHQIATQSSLECQGNPNMLLPHAIRCSLARDGIYCASGRGHNGGDSITFTQALHAMWSALLVYVQGFLLCTRNPCTWSAGACPTPLPLPLSLLRSPHRFPWQAYSMRSILKFKRPSRRVLPGLSTLKTSLEIISKAGSTLPPLQAVADTALEIIKCAEVRTHHPTRVILTHSESHFSLCQTANKNRKEAIELVEFARKIIEAVVDLPPTSEDGQADEKYEEHVLALHKCVIWIPFREASSQLTNRYNSAENSS